jgi:hypothetical protein
VGGSYIIFAILIAIASMTTSVTPDEIISGYTFAIIFVVVGTAYLILNLNLPDSISKEALSNFSYWSFKIAFVLSFSMILVPGLTMIFLGIFKLGLQWDLPGGLIMWLGMIMGAVLNVISALMLIINYRVYHRRCVKVEIISQNVLYNRT